MKQTNRIIIGFNTNTFWDKTDTEIANIMSKGLKRFIKSKIKPTQMIDQDNEITYKWR